MAATEQSRRLETAAGDAHAISLRWHDPNQVMGNGRTADSQPIAMGSPFVQGVLYRMRSDLSKNSLVKLCRPC